MLGFDLEIVIRFTALFWGVTGIFCLALYGIWLVLKEILNVGSGCIPYKPTPAPRPFMRGNAVVGNPPPKVRQDSRPQPPWKRGS